MVCTNCGTQNAPGAKFCAECGTALSAACRSCGAPLAAGAKFCSECGTPTGAAGGQTANSPAAVPQPAIAERRLVSVLFTDLVGFTSLAEGRDAEETRELLSRYFDLAREVIGRYGGTVEKFIGDAVMAVWGAPVARENDAERAVRAALDLVDAVATLGPGIQARSGVLTGEAAVTLGATNQGMVAGDLVNTASRLQSAAQPGVVLVGESTERAANSAIVFEPAGEQSLKGKAAPVAAWRAVRVIAERGGRGRSDRLEAPFVGRDDEFRLLKELVHVTARERRPRIVSITGQAGVGKSRMAWELSKYLDGLVDQVYWHAGRSPAYGEGIAFWALGEMVRSRAGLAETDDEATTREKITQTVEQWVPDEAERPWIARSLLTLLGVETGQSTREELFSAWRTFFERIGARGTSVLLFEDLHWADAGLLDFIDHLLDWSRNVPLLVVTLARPELLERRPNWGAGRRNFVGLGLEPLPEPAMRALLQGLVPGLPEAVVRSIVSRADGIPLYAVETVRMLVAEGKVVEADGAYRPTTDLSTLAVPETLHALIAARLDALDPTERSLLQDAAVLGQSFTPAALAAVSGLDERALEERLPSLVRRELLAHESDPRSPERGQYSFVQALNREVAYGTLAKRDRRARHLAAARFFESLGEEELAGALAVHYLAAYRASSGDPESQALAAQARIALRAAAARAASVGSHEQAARHYLEAIEVTDERAEIADLLELAGEASTAAGRSEVAEDHFRDAIARRRALGDVAGVARATGLLGQASVNGWRPRAAIEILEPAAREFAELGDHPALAMIEHQLARAYWFEENGTEAIGLADRALGRAERLDDVALIADVLVTKGALIALAGRPYEGLGSLRAGQLLAEEHGLVAVSVRALLNMSAAETGRDPRRALGFARQAMALAERYGLRSSLATAAGNAFEAAVRVGDWDLVVADVNQMIEQQDWEIGDRITVYRGLEEVLAYRGEPLDEILAEHREHATNLADSQELSNYHGGMAAMHLVRGEYAAAAEAWRRSAELNQTNTPVDLPRAARAALWGGDRAGVDSDLRHFRELRLHGPAARAAEVVIEAGLVALDGDRDRAVSMYSEAMTGLADLGVEFDRALTGVDMAITLGVDDPAAKSALDSARETLVRLRARPLIEVVDRLVSDGATKGPALSGVPGVTTAG